MDINKYPEVFIDEYKSYYIDNPTNIKVFLRLVEIIRLMCININSDMKTYINILDEYLLLSEINIHIIIKVIKDITLILKTIFNSMYNIFTESLSNYLHIICLNTESLSILAEKICKEQIIQECPICFESINETNIFCCESSITSKEKYKHSFHATCLYAYCKLKTDFPCPVCRRQCSYTHLEHTYNNKYDTYQDNLLKMRNYRYKLEKEISKLI